MNLADRDRLKDALFLSGAEWGKRSPDEILDAIEAADFVIFPRIVKRFEGPSLQIDHRYHRVQQLVGYLMSIVGKHLEDRRDASRLAMELFEAFFEAGAEVVTDHTRAEAGLAPRNENGWTRDELAKLEAYRLHAMLTPALVIFPAER